MLTTEPPKPTRLNTGIRILDERLGGGFERPCALLLFSRTPAEKRLFAEQFVMTGLRAGEASGRARAFSPPPRAARGGRAFAGAVWGAPAPARGPRPSACPSPAPHPPPPGTGESSGRGTA